MPETAAEGSGPPAVMRFPRIIRHKKAEATIYGKTKAYPCYRLAYRVNGQRKLKTFSSYGDAVAEANRVVRDLAAGSQVAALGAAQARDALAALQRLESFRQASGRAVGLLEAVSTFCDASARLGDQHSLADAARGFLNNVASVTRKPLAEAVEEFIALRAPLAESKDGKRPQRSPVYHANVAAWLREFAAALPGHAVADLGRPQLDAYFTAPALAKLAAKSRNDRRAALKMFFAWAVKKDWLAPTHRLTESDGLSRETVETEDMDYCRPAELRALLDTAGDDLRPIIALCGLAGLRTEEALRLDFSDLWRVAGHVEVSKTKSKGRARRLVEIGPALAAWLEPCRARAGKAWPHPRAAFFAAFADLRAGLGIASRENGLRHAYATYSFARHGNENAVAAAMGNSPGMIHAHYRGLSTKAEAEKWFAVAPAPAAADLIPLAQKSAAAHA